MGNRNYTQDHEWIETDGDIGTVGITDFAQEQLGDVVFVELPEAGKIIIQGGEAAIVESVKAASEVYSPVTGEIISSNSALNEDPALVNTAAESNGWFFKIKISNPDELKGMMDDSAYKKMLEEMS